MRSGGLREEGRDERGGRGDAAREDRETPFSRGLLAMREESGGENLERVLHVDTTAHVLDVGMW